MADTPDNNPVLQPWHDARVLLWVGAAFLMLFLATVILIGPGIQQKLDKQTKQRLQQAGINPATLELDWDYRNLTVRGYLPENTTYQQLATTIRGTSEQRSPLFAKGIRHLRLDLDDGSFTESGALALDISSDGKVTTLEGLVQTDEQRTLLVSAVLDSGVENVFDHIDVLNTPGSQQANDRFNMIAEMLRKTGPEHTRRVAVNLTETDLNYRITARDKNSAQSIEQSLAGNLEGLRITGGVDVLGAHYLDVLASSDGTSITLSGRIRSDAHQKQLVFAASEAIGSRNVVNKLQLTEAQSDAPDATAKVESAAAVISRFAPGIQGQVSLKGNVLSVNAEAGSIAVRDYIRSSTLSARQAGLKVTENIQIVLPADESQALQTELDTLIDEVRKTVVFDSGKSVLTASAQQTLNKIASLINAHESLLVEIEGHTDNVGRASVNAQLSQSRANAVKKYLAQQVDDSRLIAVGYGHRKPLDSNDTAEGRQANRRVHFTVLKSPESPG